jgi:hypothetical protein
MVAALVAAVGVGGTAAWYLHQDAGREVRAAARTAPVQHGDGSAAVVRRTGASLAGASGGAAPAPRDRVASVPATSSAIAPSAHDTAALPQPAARADAGVAIVAAPGVPEAQPAGGGETLSVGSRVLLPEPTAAQRRSARDEIAAGIARCVALFGATHERIYFQVTYQGATGRVLGLWWGAPGFARRPITPCLLDSVRGVALPSFQAERWVTSYSFQVD